jgi:sugar phosphate permease
MRPPTPQRDPHRWTVFCIISGVYFLAYFHRASTSVIVPDLIRTFQADATGLGLMSSMYFYLYALEQPVVGHLSDRLGPRRVVGLWSLVAAGGCILFGLAPTMGWASVGRALIGFGVGGVFIPGMKAFAQRFHRGEFARITGLFLAMGNVGAVMATAPLAWMAHAWGWRPSFLMIGAVTLVLAGLTLWVVREGTGGGERSVDRETAAAPPSTTWKVALRILGSCRFWILFSIFFGLFGAYGALQGLWATPFLMSVLGMDRIEASLLNMLIPAGFIVGAPLVGWLVDRPGRGKTQVLAITLIAETLLWVAIARIAGGLGTVGMALVLAALGLTVGGMATVFWALVRDATPAPILGLTTGMLNLAPFLGSALLQVWTGAILDRVGQVGGHYPPEAFERAFWVCLLAAALPTCLTWVFRRTLAPHNPAGRQGR